MTINLGLITLLFAILKLCGVISWGWFWVLSPIIFFLLFVIMWIALGLSLGMKLTVKKTNKRSKK